MLTVLLAWLKSALAATGSWPAGSSNELLGRLGSQSLDSPESGCDKGVSTIASPVAFEVLGTRS